MTDILGRCSLLEQRIADIYTQFARSLSQQDAPQRDFWLGLASEEQQHGRVLATEKALLEADKDPGNFLPDYPAKLVSLDAMVKKIEDQANQGVNIAEAFALAFDLEQSELNTIYRDLVLTGRAAGRLKADDLFPDLRLPQHQERLVDGVKQFLPDTDLQHRAEEWLTRQRYPRR